MFLHNTVKEPTYARYYLMLRLNTLKEPTQPRHYLMLCLHTQHLCVTDLPWNHQSSRTAHPIQAPDPSHMTQWPSQSSWSREWEPQTRSTWQFINIHLRPAMGQAMIPEVQVLLNYGLICYFPLLSWLNQYSQLASVGLTSPQLASPGRGR